MELTDNFRAGMQRLVSGVSVVTTVAADGGPCGMTATAVASLSLNPPALMVSLNKESRLGEEIGNVSTFAVNILGVGHRHVAEAFAGKVSGVNGSTRFVYGRWRSGEEGVPLLEDAPASFVCKIDDILNRPTHLLVIGVVTETYLPNEHAGLLIYSSRRFSAIHPGSGSVPS